MRKLLLSLVVLALMCLGGAAVDATPKSTTTSAATKHTATYTAKQRFKTKDGKTITGIRTGTGRVFTGVDKVTETVDTTPTLMAPDSASSLSWKRVAYVLDEATWTGANDGYYYTFAVQASIGWQAQPDGSFFTSGPFNYRQNPACFKHPNVGGEEIGTHCNFQFNSSALEAKACHASESCFIDAPWGFRDFYQANVISILFAGGWHSLSGTPYNLSPTGASLMSFTGDATARFLAPDPTHVTRIYCTGSFWWTVRRADLPEEVASDFCTGMTAID